MPERHTQLAPLEAERFDVLVIGGGITGAGVARDAALRGLRVALVERDDFGAGTSSRSSRLVHGGVRYLEHGHLRLVFESSRERRVLLRTAPHLVRPLRFTWPVYRGARVPRWKLEAGLALYDALALFRNVHAHRPLGRRGVLAIEPALAAHGLRGGATYYDAATDDARLTLATALAARDAGATIVNHVAVTGLAFVDGGVAATVRDALGGQMLTVRARVAVNATGPWSDDVRALVQSAGHGRLLGAKGAHIAVPAERLGNRGAVTMVSPVDGRVMFALPGGAISIIGTTETPAEHGPDAVRASERDVEYLLRSANGFFPDARLTRDDVVSAWAGIRPLASAAPAAGNTAAVSREHAIERDPRGLVTVTGGKLTTYRAMAADVVDAACAVLGIARLTRPRTDTIALPGADRAARVSALAAADPSLGRRLSGATHRTLGDAVLAVREEMALTLADVLVRRVPIAFEARDHGRAAASIVAAAIAPALGWTDADVRRELEAYDREVTRVFGIDP